MIWLLLAAFAQEPRWHALEGSTWTLSEPVEPRRGDLGMHVFRSKADCLGKGVDPAELDACAPWVDPATRRIHLAFRLEQASVGLPVAITARRLAVSVGAEKGGVSLRRGEAWDYEIVPHAPSGTGQLIVLLIDRSGSMYQPTTDAQGRPQAEGIARVVQALQSDAVKDALLPTGGGSRAAVMLLTFTDAVRGPYGEPWRMAEVLRDRAAYDKAVDALLDAPAPGFTHLYQSVQTVVSEVLLDADLAAWVTETQADPTVVLFTDGFNNTFSAQTCGDNAAELQRLMDLLRSAEAANGLGYTLHAIGLGRKFEPDFQLPLASGPITPRDLCGPAVAERIDGGLEKRGIDNVSLAWIAEAGGGRTLVHEEAGMVAGFLAQTGTALHAWYELRMHLDAIHQQRFRRALPVMVQVRSPRVASATLTLRPNPLFDQAPRGEGDVAAPTPAVAAFRVVMLGLAATFALLASPVAWHHARRALLRRFTTLGKRT